LAVERRLATSLATLLHASLISRLICITIASMLRRITGSR
jgi:hypothetical protein